eukprot:TRINITY_DN7465_c0_g1_i1.p1 TRINITY_DN7465_c0_g1~~TRINITY_DN7465_c0_g1_i1.p1  ORF type:complete len:247 (+),score=44.85 TRINITY_DN7465_c0_g1_i1:131-871(+)
MLTRASGTSQPSTTPLLQSVLCNAKPATTLSIIQLLVSAGAELEASLLWNLCPRLPQNNAESELSPIETLVIELIRMKAPLDFPADTPERRQHGRMCWAAEAGVQRSGASATALHLAASRGSMSVVAELIRAGADPDFKDRYGRTAYDWSSYETKKLFLYVPWSHTTHSMMKPLMRCTTVALILLSYSAWDEASASDESMQWWRLLSQNESVMDDVVQQIARHSRGTTLGDDAHARCVDAENGIHV